MEQQDSAPNTLRDALEASFDAVEQQVAEPVAVSVEDTSDRVRDEKGKFAKVDVEPLGNPSPVATTHDVPEQQTGLQRPSTWKKEYLPLWDKMQNGEQLTQEEAIKFLQYTNQRESEYKTGVSTYRGEAENAKALQEAIAPFVPDLQRHGIHPAAWINNLGRAHQTLALGNDNQRLEAFIKLAQDYQVPLDALLGGQQPDQNITFQMQELQNLRNQVSNITQWTENEKNARLQAQIDRVRMDAEHYPHFEQVRGTMAQILESGLAPTLEEAYAKAIRMQDDVWQQEQERLLANARATVSTQQHVAKAKSAGVSLKSQTPSGSVQGADKKDRRAILESSFEEVAGRV